MSVLNQITTAIVESPKTAHTMAGATSGTGLLTILTDIIPRVPGYIAVLVGIIATLTIMKLQKKKLTAEIEYWKLKTEKERVTDA